MSRYSKTKHLTFLAFLFAVAMVLATLESLFPPPLPIPLRYGLANVVVMYLLYEHSKQDALIIVLLKALYVLLLRGLIAGVLSLSGSLLAWLILVVLLLPKLKVSYLLASTMAAIAHNLAQLVVVSVLYSSLISDGWQLLVAPLIFWGAVTGVVSGLVLKIILPRIRPIIQAYHIK